MITEFFYTPTADDFAQFQKFRLKQSKIGFIYYLLFAIMLAFSIYESITTKDIIYFLCTGIMCLIVFLTYIYEKNYKTKRQILKLQKKDSTYLSKNKVTLYSNAIEINTGTEDGSQKLCLVYPFSIINMVLETSDAYYLFISGEVRIISKREMSEENKQLMTQTIKKIPNYRFAR